MRRRLLAACLCGFIAGGLTLLAGQSPQPTPSPVTSDVQTERRLSHLEQQQAVTIDALKRSTQQYETLLYILTALGTAFGTVLVALQSFWSFAQYRRENAQEARQVAREATRDTIDRQGIESVSKVLDVVYKTQQAHLAAEGRTQEIQGQLDKMKDKMNRFLDTHQQVITRNRNEIEQTASDLALTARHDFRRKIAALKELASHYDRFDRDYQSFDDSGKVFTARVKYIRGVASHYMNQPDLVNRFLGFVVQASRPEADEPRETAFQKRQASAYYYLGLTLANFNLPEALDQFEKASATYPDTTDFLSRLVWAESSLQQQQACEDLLTHVEEGSKQKETQDPKNTRVYVRLRSRAALIRCNGKLMRYAKAGKPGRAVLDEVRSLIEPVVDIDNEYYYAASTLAQVLHELGAPEATARFREAYDAILASHDLLTVTEVRSKILLRMVAALCVAHGIGAKETADRYLAEANDLIESLPRMESRTCTVFSPLSKWNEEAETIRQHIDLIRLGRVWSWQDRRTGADRRTTASPSWQGPEHRSGTDRRVA